MGIYYALPDYDRDIQKLKRPPIILNEIRSDEYELIDPVRELTMTEYEGDVIDTLPSCECGMTTGRYNTSTQPDTPNTVCPHCDTEVMSPIDRGFESSVWIRVPYGVRAFIRINALDMLMRAFKQDDFSAIEWLCNTRYEPKNRNSVIYERFKKLEIPRGYNHFIDNFDAILETLMTAPVFKPDQKRTEVYDFMRNNRHLLFSQYLPLPSRRSIITELSNKTRFCAEGYVNVIDAARAIYGLVGKEEPRYQNTREHNTFKALTMLIAYREFVDKNVLGSKPGWYRKQIFGSRTGPTYRGVVSSLSGAHDYEEMHMPWGMGVTLYHTHLLGMLMRDGLTLAQSERFIIDCVGQYDPYMHDLLNRLIERSPYTTLQGKRGLPQILGRNPTLNLRSVQSLFVTKFKTDPHDNTIGLSLLILKAPNCDFDGDQLAGMPILSREDFIAIRKLSPHTGTFDLNKPLSLNNNMEIGKPVRSTINNFLYGRHH